MATGPTGPTFEASTDPARTDVRIPCGRDQLAAWLYRPPAAQDGDRRPIVVMGHGLGGVKEMGLDPYARRFAAAGYWVLVFDYRGFGESGGTPRQVVRRRQQLSDWNAALRYASRLPGIDPAAVVAWGSSYGGGLVIDVVRRNPTLAAGVAQCPFTDGLASALAGNPVTMLRLGLHGAVDVVAHLRGRPPHLVPVCAAPWRLGFLTSRDSLQYERLKPPGRSGPELMAARFAFAVMFQRPGRSLGKSPVPLLLCVCDHDLEAPARATLRHAKGTGVEVKRYPLGHFQIYVDDGFEQSVTDQLAFLKARLDVAAPERDAIE